jgi:hypothetical protein
MIPKKKQYKAWSLPNKYTFWGVILTLVFGLIGFLVIIFQVQKWSSTEREQKKRDREDTRKGVLESINKANSEFFKVRIGGFTVNCTKNDLESGINIASLIANCNGDSMPVSIKLLNGKILLNSKFYNLDDEIVGEIIDNNWAVNSNSLFMRNYDDNAIEVIDNYDVVVMQVRMEANSIIINGIVHCGNLIFICNENSSYNLDKSPGAQKHWKEMTGETLKDQYIKNGRKIERIFEYTGENWLGKRKI